MRLLRETPGHFGKVVSMEAGKASTKQSSKRPLMCQTGRYHPPKQVKVRLRFNLRKCRPLKRPLRGIRVNRSLPNPRIRPFPNPWVGSSTQHGTADQQQMIIAEEPVGISLINYRYSEIIRWNMLSRLIFLLQFRVSRFLQSIGNEQRSLAADRP